MKIEIKHTITGQEISVDGYTGNQAQEYIKQGSQEDKEFYEYLQAKILLN